jgi:hypothetical protein
LHEFEILSSGNETEERKKNTVIMERLDPKGNLDEEISQIKSCQFVFSFFSDRNP